MLGEEKAMDQKAMKPKVFIDGAQIQYQPGERILDAAHRAGRVIPTLCHDPRLGSSGACRLCLVKIEGADAPVPACDRELQPGMRVITEDEDLLGWRRAILKLALSENPPETCTACQQVEPCRLHALAQAHGVEASAYAGRTSGRFVQDPNPFIVRDYTQCIHCYRCTQVCSELEAAQAIFPSGRGFETQISTSQHNGLLESPCTFCGQCIQVCPTGALFEKKRLGKASAEEVTKVRTTCPYCGTGCGIELHVADDRVVGVSPDWTAPANQGSLCVKGQFAMDFIHHRQRLTTPLIRTDGELKPATWEEAYRLIADRMQQIKEQNGPDAFALWSSSRATNEANYLFQKLGRAVLGTNNIDNCART